MALGLGRQRLYWCWCHECRLSGRAHTGGMTDPPAKQNPGLVAFDPSGSRSHTIRSMQCMPMMTEWVYEKRR